MKRLLTLLLLTSIVLAGCQFQPIDPANAVIVYVSTDAETGQADIAVSAEDGYRRAVLTDTPEQEVSPIWSADGRQIAYAVESAGGWVIAVMDADGRNNRVVLSLSGNMVPLDWSDDGERLLLRMDTADGDSLTALDLSNDESNPLGGTWDRLAAARFAPEDGIIFAAGIQAQGDGAIVATIDTASGETVEERSLNMVGGTISDVSSDGRQVLYTADEDAILHIRDVESGRDHSFGWSLLDDRNARFGPDERLIVFESDRDGDYEVFEINPSGGFMRQLTNNDGRQDTMPDLRLKPD